ncbi:MAG: prepilin peptidase, partial [Puniceicoccales bacterium]|nr:prepilin peptidase [Puniceicoccales bacterium]
MMAHLLVLLFAIGACIGSFLAVCVDRLPRGESVIFGRSRCVCGRQIPAHLNIPILSWLFLGGRARCCGAKIPFKFFLLELLSGILLPLMFLTQKNVVQASIFFSFVACLLIASFIDIATLEIPDVLSVGLAAAGLVISAIFPEIHGTSNVFIAAERSVSGLLFGSGALFWIGALGEQIFKKDAIGLGDVKLVGAIGTFCGIGGSMCAIFGGSAVGLLVVIPIFIGKYIASHTKPTSIVPFAPFLSAGVILF